MEPVQTGFAILTTKQRSELMSKIRSKGNRTTELALIRVLKAEKIIGWRRGAKLPGKPDFVFPRLKLAVFVDGDFWHGNPAYYRQPTSNIEYWIAKIERNRRRDRAVTRKLTSGGWKVIRIWESTLKNDLPLVARRLRRVVRDRHAALERTTAVADSLTSRFKAGRNTAKIRLAATASSTMA